MPPKKIKTSISATTKKQQTENVKAQMSSNIYDLLGEAHATMPVDIKNNKSKNRNKSQVKSDIKSESKSESKSEIKSEIKTEVKTEVDSDGFRSVNRNNKLTKTKNTPPTPTHVPIVKQPVKHEMITPSIINSTIDSTIDSTIGSTIDSTVNSTVNSIVDTVNDTTSISAPVAPKIVQSQKGIYVPPTVSDAGWTMIGNNIKKRRDRVEKDGSSIEPEQDKTPVTYYDSSVKLPGDDMKLHTTWTVWIHANDNPDWSLESYKAIYEIDSVGSMWRFLHVLENLDKSVRQYFIMRSGITPIWEDNNNKQGGICSIMIDNMSRSRSGGDLGVDAFSAICIMVLNESFVKNNQIINGLCYSIKSRSALIKLWIKDYELHKNFKEVIPLTILKHIDTMLLNMDSHNNYNRNSYVNRSNNSRSKISVRLTQIKPNY